MPSPAAPRPLPALLSSLLPSLPLCVLLTLSTACVPPGGGDGGDDDVGTDPRPDTGADPAPDAGPDPADAAPDAAACTPDCADRTCGGDGCGGVCGACPEGEVCTLAGRCAAPSADCGDGQCGADEDCSTCPADCGACCGNGACDGALDETCATCPADCGCAAGERCDAAQRCVAECVPDCADRACGEDGCGGSCGACPEGVDCVAGACEAPEPGAPRFLSLSTDVRRITVGESVRISAVMTDPDGLDDLAAGVLESPAGQSYGAFVSSGGDGAYAITVSWADVMRVDPIDFADATGHTFVAIFFDQGGLRALREIQVELYCDGGSACGGVCVGTADDPTHCGGCGVVCGEGAICAEGACACPPGGFACDGDRCVPPDAVCDRRDDCADGADEAGCCFADGECPVGQRCVGNRCAAGCADDGRCGEGQICEDGQCVGGCRDDAACGPGRICEDAVCADGCRDDAACGPGRICEDLLCVEGCRDDAACGDGRICSDGACIAGCRDDAACPPAQACVDAICLPGCRVGGCPDGLRCDPELRECVDPFAGTCRPCAGRADCPDGFSCLNYQQGEAPACAPGGCVDDGDCPAGSECVLALRDGEQIPVCADRAECHAPELSDWPSPDEPPLCDRAADCTADEVCTPLPTDLQGRTTCLVPCDDGPCPGDYTCCLPWFEGDGAVCLPPDTPFFDVACE